ncbi:MAG TPA: hypothetical protein VHW23_29530 [Kofleriaceae bacterium]|nr:hypothetical protein [Kofleriaceae bacterium]
MPARTLPWVVTHADRESDRGSSVLEHDNHRKGHVMKHVHVLASVFAASAIWLSGCAVDPSQGAAGDPPQASAGEAASSPGSRAHPGHHCVLSATSELSCFATFTEAMAAGSSGRIADAPSNVKAALSDPGFNARVDALAAAPAAQIVVVILYDDTDQDGDSFAIWKGSGCDGDITTKDHDVASLTPYGWDDSVESLHSYSQCHTVLYANDNWTGARTGKIGTSNNVGDIMSDEANSLEFY